jgi:hypothetical protein
VSTISAEFIEACRAAGACEEGLAWCEAHEGEPLAVLLDHNWYWAVWALNVSGIPERIAQELFVLVRDAEHGGDPTVAGRCRRVSPAMRQAAICCMPSFLLSEVLSGAWSVARADYVAANWEWRERTGAFFGQQLATGPQKDGGNPA